MKINLKSIKDIIKLIVLIVLTIGLFFIVKYGLELNDLNQQAKSMVSNLGSDVFYENQVTVVYDKNGEIICELSGDKKTYYLELEKIPAYVKDAFMVSEDRSFYEHSGIDYKAVLRAFIALIENEGEITQGGSTITQQLARNIYLTHEVTLERKIKEMFIAMELEREYSKEEILEFYINNIYYANGYYGIGAAAKGYLGKEVEELNLKEIAFLCAIPNNPTKYDPITNFENAIDRSNLILMQMYNEGYIDGDTYNEALYMPVKLSQTVSTKHDYVETFVRFCATKELMRNRGFVFNNDFDSVEEREEYEVQYEEEYAICNALLFSEGYEIYTSIDLEMQEKLQNSVDSVLAGYTDVNEEGIYKLQGSAVCIDNNTGFVTAIVGGREQEYDGYTLNRAYQSHRQPGSAIKPLIVYTPLLEIGYSPDTRVLDEAFEDSPDNYYEYYLGELSFRRAVEISVNTIPWRLLNKIGIGKGISYLKNMNFSKIDTKDYVPAVSIGGMTYGVSALEMAAAYATIENDGTYRNATCIVSIEDTVDNRDNNLDSKAVYDINAARMMTDILKGVMINGTGESYALSNAITAGKTGTTNNERDVWMVGYSHYYTTAVWCGYDLPENLSEVGAMKCAGNIWHDFMENIHTDLEKMEFTTYKEVDGSAFDEIEEETTEEEKEIGDNIEEESTTSYEEESMTEYEEETTTYNNWDNEAESMGSYEEMTTQ